MLRNGLANQALDCCDRGWMVPSLTPFSIDHQLRFCNCRRSPNAWLRSGDDSLVAITELLMNRTLMLRLVRVRSRVFWLVCAGAFLDVGPAFGLRV